MKHTNQIVVGGMVKRYTKTQTTSVLMMWMHFEGTGMEKGYVPITVQIGEDLYRAVDDNVKLEGTVLVTGELRRDDEGRIFLKADNVVFGEGRIE